MTMWAEMSVFLLDLMVKATALMAVTFFILKVFGKDHANWRSLILNLCVVGLLLMPFASVLMPDLQVSFYPKLDTLPQSQSVISFDGIHEMDEMPFGESEQIPIVDEPTVVEEVVSSPEVVQVPVTVSEAEIPSAVTSSYFDRFSLSVPQLLVGVYLLGLMWMLLRLCVQGIRGRLFLQSLRPCADAHLVSRLQVLRDQLRIRRPVRLVHGEHIQSPTLFGVFQPTIVFPDDMSEIEDVDAVLVHELIHVRRFDCLFRVLGEAMRAMYWFHPLAWMVKRSLSEVQEHACDDWTIATVGNSHAYATLLLAVATRFQKQTPVVVGMEMARRPEVFTRVERILTLGGCVSKPIGRLAVGAVAVFFVCGATALGSMVAAKKMFVVDNLPFRGGTPVADTKKRVSESAMPRKMRDGRLWWQGLDGLYLQDGNHWEKHTIPNGKTFTQTTAFLNARDGSVWFAGYVVREMQVAQFDGNKWRVWGSDSGIGIYDVGGRMAEDEHGGIWIGTRRDRPIDARGATDRVEGGHGVLHFDGENWHRYTVADGLIHNRVYDVQADPRGGVWIGTLRGLSHYKDGVWTSHIPDPIPVKGVRNANPHDGRKVYKMLFDRNDHLWVAHGAGIGRTMTRNPYTLSRFDGQSWTHYNSASGFPMGATRYIDETNDGSLWFGSNRDDQPFGATGVVRYKDGMWLRFTQTHGIEGDVVPSIVQTEDGEFLIRTENGRRVFIPPLNALAQISGRLTDGENGKFVPNMGIWVETEKGEIHAGTMTDDKGQYQVQVVPGTYRVRIASRNAVHPVPVTVESQGQVRGIDLAMLKSKRITGLVVDQNKNPIPNAVIVLSDDRASNKQLSSQVLVSAKDGTFEGWQFEGTYALFEVAAQGYVQKQLAIENVKEENITIMLNDAAHLRGRVVDQFGKPYAGARIGIGEKNTIFDDIAPKPFQKNTYTDASGTFELPDVDPNGTVVWINHPDVGYISQSVIPKPDIMTLVFDRLALYEVAGVVMTHNGPLSGASVNVRRIRGGASSGYSTKTDKDGAYQIQGLEPGRYAIRVSTDMPVTIEKVRRHVYRGLYTRPFTIVDSSHIINFTPVGRAKIIGVAKHEGQPVAGAQVFALHRKDDPTQTELVGSGWTDDDGRFVLEDLPNAEILINLIKMRKVDGIRRQWTKMDTIDLREQNEWVYQTEVSFTKPRKSLQVGQRAPDFVGKRLDGTAFQLADYKGKKAVLIDFWATWCGPCLPEIPHIQSIHEKYGDDLMVVGVSLDHSQKDLTDFIKKEQVSYAQVFGIKKAKEISESFGVSGIPSVFLIDREGVIRATNLRGLATEEAVRKLLSYKEG